VSALLPIPAANQQAPQNSRLPANRQSLGIYGLPGNAERVYGEELVDQELVL